MQGIRVRQGVIALTAPIVVGTMLLFLWLLWQSPLALMWQQPAPPAVMRLIPAPVDQAVILMRPVRTVTALLQTLTPPTQRRRQRQEWQHWLAQETPFSSLWQAAHLEPQTDILPWLGCDLAEVQVGSDHLLVLSTRQREQSNLFLNLLWQSQDLAGSPLHLNTYKGVQVVSFDLPPLGTVGTAALGDRYVLISTNPSLILTSIDTWERPQHSLIRDPEWQRMPARHRGQVGWWFERGQRYLSIGVSGQGVTLRGLVQPSLPVGSRHRAQVLKHLPAHSEFILAGTTLAATWANEQASQPTWLWDPWRRWADQQPLPWIEILPPTHEFALALVSESTTAPRTWLYVTADPVAAAVAQTLETAGWTPQEHEGITTWDPPQSAKGAILTTTDHGRFYLSSSLKTLKAAVRGTPAHPWTAHLPIENLGYVHAHFPSGEHLTVTRMESAQPMLQQVKGLLRMG